MSSQALDLTGRWDGSYSYPSGFGAITPFLADIEQTAGGISGSIIEPDLAYGSGATMTAILSGHRQGHSVDFTKSYLGRRFGYANPVDYVGQVSRDGLRIAGVWSLLDIDGTFEMHRDAAPTEEEVREAEVEEPVDAATLPHRG